MPNQNSHARHLPQRTCVVCKSKREIASLMCFHLLPQGLVFDPQRRLQKRRNYVCPERACLEGLDKWKRAKGKRLFGKPGEPVFTRPETSLKPEVEQ